MAATSTVLLTWSHGEDTFCLGKVGLILDLEEKCDAGIAAILGRLHDGTWRLNDVRETIRLGLMGGGMKTDRALDVVRRHVDTVPLAVSSLLAYKILEAVLVGVPGDPLGKTGAGRTKKKAAASSVKKDALSDPPSTGVEQR